MNKLKLCFLFLVSCLPAIWLGFLFLAPSAQAATLTLAPASLSLTESQAATPTLNLDPQGDLIIGTDVFINFDPRYLKIISVVRRTFASTPATIIDNTKGQVKFSLANPYGVYQTTPGAVADLTIQGLSPVSTTPINFSFTPGSTRDTNVVAPGGQDVLTTATGTTIAITSQNQSTTNSSPTPTATPTPSAAAAATILPEITAVSTAKPKPTPTINPDESLIQTPPAGFIAPLPPPKPPAVLGAATPTPPRFPWFLIPLAILLITAAVLLLRRLHHPRRLPQYPTPKPALAFS
ncbi:hypothetical protein A2W24_04980 [Microgenomates group bacterium RBG_16_45_19]|nr:MAG: hypothetical protein A2W24_04980 [Microgenomates group bacterium RBG_16_45_19]